MNKNIMGPEEIKKSHFILGNEPNNYTTTKALQFKSGGVIFYLL